MFAGRRSDPFIPTHQCPPWTRLIRIRSREEIHVYTVGITSFKEVKNTLFQLYEQHQFVLLPFQGQRSFIQLHMYISVHLHYKMSKYFAYLIWNDLFSPIFETSMFKVNPFPLRALLPLGVAVDYKHYIDLYKLWLEFGQCSIWSVFYL